MSAHEPPLVSVVIPMRNGEPFIGQTLEQIFGQEGCSVEVIVVNDGSTDGSDEAVASRDEPNLRMIEGPCQGIAPSLNAGLAACCGRYVVRCDADDLMPAGRLAWQVAFLESHEAYAAVCGAFRTITDKGRALSEMRTGDEAQEITSELKSGHTRTHFGTFMTRRSVLLELEGARPYFNGVEDIDLQLRIGTGYRVWYEPRSSYDYRLHGSSITHVQPSPQRIFLTETARRFALQRVAGEQDDLMRGCPPKVPQGGEAPVAMDVRKQQQGILLSEAWRHHRAGDRRRALAVGWRAGWQSPAQLKVWWSLGMLVMKRPRPQAAEGQG